MIVFVICLSVMGAVCGDVSHLLQGGSNGYDYAVPAVKFPEPENNYLPPLPILQPQQECPQGTYGTYPNCEGLSASFLPIPTPQCPPGAIGRYPNCQVPTSSVQHYSGLVIHPKCIPSCVGK